MAWMPIGIFDLNGVLFINLSYFYEFMIKDKMIRAMKGFDLRSFENFPLMMRIFDDVWKMITSFLHTVCNMSGKSS